MKFSDRIGISHPKTVQLKNIDYKLRNRLINAFEKYVSPNSESSYLVDKLGLRLNPYNIKDQLLNYLEDCIWFEIYNVIEDYMKYLEYSSKESVGNLKIDYLIKYREVLENINKILEEEKSGYRIICNEIAKVTDEQEIKSIEESIATEFDSVNTHFTKALQLYSDRQAPDYENSIKESISAVEAMCCIINGTSDTLGKALKKLKDNGIEIHNSLEEAFRKLYGYTSDTHGIRHGGIDFTNASEEDAKYMLVSCSAFINYLKVKYSKLGGKQ